MRFTDRLKKGWNAFLNRDLANDWSKDYGRSYGGRPDRPMFTKGRERSLVTTVLNRIAVDCASVDVRHVRLDEYGRYMHDIEISGLSECLTLEANMDQTARAFMLDVVMSLLDEGCVAIVPTDADVDIDNNSFDIYTMRTAKIIQWYPAYVKVDIYNERKGEREQINVPKKSVAIIENPFYAIMNQPNSTMQRLIRKLALLDRADEHNASGKLDMIIQLPYIIRTEARREQAEKRRKDIEMQLSSSAYGIAYTDGTEKIMQLNRSIESQFQKEIEYYTDEFLSQMGLTKEILNGTADEKAMLNYQSRIIEPIMSAIVEEMRRKFLTTTARTQGQDIRFFKDPFKLVPVNDIAEIADKFTRNEIMTSNEIRQAIGMTPSEDARADELRNSNLSESNADIEARMNGTEGLPMDEFGGEMAQSAINVLNAYLAHHGILGQKWGKKNGPPYPLDPSDHSAREKKLNDESTSDKKKKKTFLKKHASTPKDNEEDDRLPSEFLDENEKQDVINELNKAGKQMKARIFEDATRTIREIKGDWDSSDEEVRKKYAKDYKDQLIDTAYDELDYKTNKQFKDLNKRVKNQVLDEIRELSNDFNSPDSEIIKTDRYKKAYERLLDKEMDLYKVNDEDKKKWKNYLK